MENTKEEKPEEITPIDQMHLTRRNFLQVVGVFTVSAGVGTLLGCEPLPEEPDASEPACMGYIVVDSRKCQGCLTCMIACSLAHEGCVNLSRARLQITQSSFACWPEDITINQCHQCLDALCVKACPTGALIIDTENGNIRLVDQSLCVGCGRCFKACPFEPERPVLAPESAFEKRLKSRKCDLCLNAAYHFHPDGGGVDGIQTCVAVCPMNAIMFTTVAPGEDGYDINLRDWKWAQLGFTIT